MLNRTLVKRPPNLPNSTDRRATRTEAPNTEWKANRQVDIKHEGIGCNSSSSINHRGSFSGWTNDPDYTETRMAKALGWGTNTIFTECVKSSPILNDQPLLNDVWGISALYLKASIMPFSVSLLTEFSQFNNRLQHSPQSPLRKRLWGSSHLAAPHHRNPAFIIRDDSTTPLSHFCAMAP